MRRILIYLAIVVILLSLPVFLYFVHWSINQIYEQLGTIPFVMACFSGLVFILGIAALIDEARRR